jgi:hypothetical protein
MKKIFLALLLLAASPSLAQIKETPPSSASTVALATSLIVKATGGVLYSIKGDSSKGSAQFIQLHDSATLPADTAIPKMIIRVPATTSFEIDFGIKGRQFLNGIVVTNSSTAATKTIGSADLWIDALYK